MDFRFATGRRRSRRPLGATALAITLALGASGAAAATQVDGAIVETELVSGAESGGTTANGASPSDPITGTAAVLSEDGRFAAFTSQATDLTSDADTNGQADVFLWDRAADEVTLVSTNAAGTDTAGGPSNVRAISGDGAYVVFRSRAADVTAHTDANENWDLFLWERSSGETTLISEAASGTSTADDTSPTASITPDGAWVLFESYAADLTTDTESNHDSDVFLWERATGEITVVTRDAEGTAAGGTAGGISDDGRYVAFKSHGTLTADDEHEARADVFLWDRITGETTLVTKRRADRPTSPDERVGASGISGDGSTVLVTGDASDLSAEPDQMDRHDDSREDDVFAWDRATDTMMLVSRSTEADRTANGPSRDARVNHDGTVVSFTSWATDLTDDEDTNEVADVFAWSRATGEVVLVSRQEDGSAAGTLDGQVSGDHGISANGEFVAFESSSATVTADPDDNDALDVFRWERATGDIVLVSADQDGDAAGEPGSSGSQLQHVSASGAEVLFSSEATDITSHEDQPDTVDLFLAHVVGGACPPGEVPDAGFTDTSGSVHADAIDCLAWWDITRGKTDQRYDPSGDVSRAQMASFLVRLAEAAGVDVPQDPPDRFTDDEGTPHELAIDQLAELDVVSGRDEDTYDPHAPVTRAEMAAFLVRTYELTTGDTLSSSTDHFDDDEQSGHEDAINAVAGAGFTTGVTETTYEPARSVSRAQMASFLTRLLDPLVVRGLATPPG